MEIERPGFAYAAVADRLVPRHIALALQRQRDIGQVAVNLVGRSEDDGGSSAAAPQRFEQIERAAQVDLEIFQRTCKARGDGDLSRQMKHSLHLPRGAGDLFLVTYVGDDRRDALRVSILQPCEVRLHTGERGKRRVGKEWG